VAAVLGHATLAMAARYAHIGSADLRAAMDPLPAPAKPAAVGAVGRMFPSRARRSPGSTGRRGVPVSAWWMPDVRTVWRRDWVYDDPKGVIVSGDGTYKGTNF
jgi:hypothetical protein